LREICILLKKKKKISTQCFTIAHKRLEQKTSIGCFNDPIWLIGGS
jgi:hypothetical protein